MRTHIPPPGVRPADPRFSSGPTKKRPGWTLLPADKQAEFAKTLAALIEKHNVVLDAASYRSAPPGLRIWCGATIERSDLEASVPWLDCAFATCATQLPKN